MTAKRPRTDGAADGAVCYVTIGATAPFDELVKAVLDFRTVQILQNAGFRLLVVQHGEGREELFAALLGQLRQNSILTSLEVVGRAFYPSLLSVVRPSLDCVLPSGRPNGIVIGHGGSGTILDCLRLEVPLVVVPNEALADNHQSELAVELDRLGYVVHGQIRNLGEGIDRALRMLSSPIGSDMIETEAASSIGEVIQSELALVE